MTNNQLQNIVERIERMEESKKAVSDDIRFIYAEAKGSGYDVKALRTIIRRRKQGTQLVAQQEAIVEQYMVALGMLADTPLGQHAIEMATA